MKVYSTLLATALLSTISFGAGAQIDSKAQSAFRSGSSSSSSSSASLPAGVLLEEHFNENDRGWNLGETNNVVRKISGGKMKLECNKYLAGGGGYWIRLPDFKLPATNYSISFTTNWIKNSKTDDSYSPYGMILGDYYFLLYGDGDRRLLKYDTTTKKYDALVDWGVQTAINKKGLNKVEIQYQDGKCVMYVNGQMMFRKEIFIPTSTSIKLYVENSEHVDFDDIVVKRL